jgi:hypothetical protein
MIIEWPNSVPLTEFSNEFVQFMANRMATSFFKYGPLELGYPNKINALESLQDRLREYKRTLNTEFLVDAANFCLIEFLKPSLKGAFFKATDSNESTGRVTTSGYSSEKKNSEIILL